MTDIKVFTVKAADGKEYGPHRLGRCDDIQRTLRSQGVESEIVETASPNVT